MPEPQVRFSPQPRQDAICPFCHDDLLPETEVVVCGGCGAAYHADCLGGELAGCATLGCEVRPELGKRGTWGELNDHGRQAELVDRALQTAPVREPSVWVQLRPWLVALAIAVLMFFLRWIGQ